MSPVSVGAISDTDRSLWDAYVNRAASANLYQLYGWRAIFEESFACETHYLAANDGRKIVGILPLFIVLPSLLGGNYVSSLPGGICADDVEAAGKLIQAAIDYTHERSALYLKLRDGDREWSDSRLQTIIEYTFVLTGLQPNPAILWRELKSNVRTPVRKAQQAGINVTCSNENLPGFYQAYATNMRDLGSPSFPRHFFEASLARFPDNIHVLAAFLAGRVIGGMYLFMFKDTLHNLFASSLRQVFNLGVNDSLYWQSICHAHELGNYTFDMGRSVLGSGPARFKEKYTAKSKPIYYHYYLHRTKNLPTSRGGNAYPLFSAVWKHLPLFVANRLSRIIRRVVPLG